MNKQKLIELRCKAWGITEDEYYCNQCSDFSLEDMARAYRRGKNKGARDKAIQNVGFYQNQMQAIYDKKNKQIAELSKHILDLQKDKGNLTDRVRELEQQIEKMLHTFIDLLWFEEHLDPYMYECNGVQKGELLKPFDNARLFLEKYKCKKCKGEGIIKVGYNGWTTNPCPACEGKGYILRR